MARGPLSKTDAEGDLASGMGLAIGAFIALFAGAIFFFMLGPDAPQRGPAQRGAPALSTPATATPVSAERR